MIIHRLFISFSYNGGMGLRLERERTAPATITVRASPDANSRSFR